MQNFEYNAFHNFESLTQQLQILCDSYPQWTSLYSIGTSQQGREIWCLQISDNHCPTPTNLRQAVLVTGNMHSVELAGSCQVLHFAEQLLESLSETTVDFTLREQVFYLIPRITPDGTEKALQNGARNRSRWIEFKRDNCLIPEDINGDGQILEMRWKSESGKFSQSSKDSRIMVPRQPGDCGPFYDVMLEGTIHNWDGSEIRRLPVLSDFNRNFPTTEWKPMPDWIGHGRYPLSEPETRAVADFVLSHPNITRVADFHTGNFAVFRPYAVRPSGHATPRDKNLVNGIGNLAEQLTGWPYVTSYEEIKGKGADVDGTFGTFKDWLFESLGLPAYVMEMGMLYNYYGVEGKDLTRPEREFAEKHNQALLKVHDTEPERRLFQEWEKHHHPQLGEIEIGGWDVIQWSNPPLPEGMQEACEAGSRFIFELAKWQIELKPSVEVTPVEGGVFRITLRIVNTGALATSVTEQGQKVLPDSMPQAQFIPAPGMQLLEGNEFVSLPHIDSNGGSAQQSWWVRVSAGDEDSEVANKKTVANQDQSGRPAVSARTKEVRQDPGDLNAIQCRNSFEIRVTSVRGICTSIQGRCEIAR